MSCIGEYFIISYQYLAQAKWEWRKIILYLEIFSFIGLSYSCAKQGFPPGGPKDETAPSVIKSNPSPHATNVSRTDPITITFSEPMDVKSVEDNLFIIPIPSVWPQCSWESREQVIEMVFSEPFHENTTSIITIGTKAKDLRNNQMKASYVLSFSTGETIESRKITGSVSPYNFFSEKREVVSGIDIVAYRLDGRSLDPDPRVHVPDYVTQTNSNGGYEIIGLSKGIYRLFAIGDKDHNGFYSEGYDEFGITPHDVKLAPEDSVTFAPDIAVSPRDTTAIQLLSLRAADNQRVELFFDREILPSSVTITFEGLDVRGWFIPFENKKIVSVATAVQENGKRYSVRGVRAKDNDGNEVLPVQSAFSFVGTERADTTALEIVSKQPKILSSLSDHITLIFNRVITLTESGDSLFLPESYPGLTVNKVGTNRLELVPQTGWPENSTFFVIFNRERLIGSGGNKLSEASSHLSLRVAPSDTLGFIEGTIDDATNPPDGLYRLVFKNIDTETMVTLTVQNAKEWATGPVLPGRYIGQGFRDDNSDGAFNRGALHPLTFAEPLSVYPDTIKVTSRWTNKGHTFIFR